MSLDELSDGLNLLIDYNNLEREQALKLAKDPVSAWGTFDEKEPTIITS